MIINWKLIDNDSCRINKWNNSYRGFLIINLWDICVIISLLPLIFLPITSFLIYPLWFSWFWEHEDQSCIPRPYLTNSPGTFGLYCLLIERWMQSLMASPSILHWWQKLKLHSHISWRALAEKAVVCPALKYHFLLVFRIGSKHSWSGSPNQLPLSTIACPVLWFCMAFPKCYQN